MGEKGENGDYMLIVGGGKVGWNLARELIDKGHEVTLIEADRDRYLTVEQELEHRVLYGDASELWVLERAGIARAGMVIAVTGDDEDNLLICQVAKDKYGVDRVIARVNNPRNRQHFELLGVKPYVSATDLILRLIERQVPRYGLVHLLDLADAKIEIIDLLIGENAQVVGRPLHELDMPKGSLLISVMRDGTGFVPTPDTVLGARRRGAGRARPEGGGGADRLPRPRRGHGRPDARSLTGGRSRGRPPAGRRRRRLRLLRLRAAQARRRGLGPARRPRAGAALRPPAPVEGVPARRRAARGCPRPSALLVRGERRRAADRKERHLARRRGPHGQDPGRGGGRLRHGPDRGRRDGEHPPRRRRPARRASTTCAPSGTPTRSARTSPPPSTSSASAAATSAPRWPRR